LSFALERNKPLLAVWLKAQDEYSLGNIEVDQLLYTWADVADELDGPTFYLEGYVYSPALEHWLVQHRSILHHRSV